MKPVMFKIILVMLSGLLLVHCTVPSVVTPASNVMLTSQTSSETLIGGTLSFVTAAGTQSFTLEELQAELPTATMTVDDPVYKEENTYEGFWLTDLLDYTNLLEGPGDVLLFRAADGYEARLDVARLDEAGLQGLVAYRDIHAEQGWESFTKGNSELLPAPYFLIWGVPEDASEKDLADVDTTPPRWPWTYQLLSIEMIDFATKYDRLFPADVAQESEVYRGFEIFAETCVKCHSINLQGGSQGPELNIPQNITEYRDHDTLVAFIKNPNTFRFASKMPAMENKLTDVEIDNVLTYIAWMADHKTRQ